MATEARHFRRYRKLSRQYKHGEDSRRHFRMRSDALKFLCLFRSQTLHRICHRRSDCLEADCSQRNKNNEDPGYGKNLPV